MKAQHLNEREHVRAILLRQASLARIRAMYQPTSELRDAELARAKRMEDDTKTDFFVRPVDSDLN